MENDKANITDEFTLRELLLRIKEWSRYIFSKYKIIVLLGLVGAVIGVAYSYTKKPLYTATLTFAMEDEKSGGLSGALGIAGQLGLDMGSSSNGGVFAGANIIELFKSRMMVEKTLLTPITIKNKTISLAEMYIQDNQWRQNWKEKPKLKNIRFLPNSRRELYTREQDSILECIYKSLSNEGLSVMQKDKKVSIITIEVKTTNEVFSKTFNESLAIVVSDFYIKTKSKKAFINMTILQKQLDSIRGELNNSITGVAVANDKTFALNPALNVKRVPSARRQVDVQTNSATLGELVKQTELAKVAVRKETPLIQIIDKPIYPLKKEKFGKAKGIVFGGFIAGFLTVMYFVVKRLYEILMKE